MQHYVSLCAIAKNEDELIRDWIDYHLLLGVEHFYLYDNQSARPLAETLADHLVSGVVTLHEAKGRFQHLSCYRHCVDEYGRDTRWLGFLDIDEFVVLKKDYDLRLFLLQYEDHPGLSANWAAFGSGRELGTPRTRRFVGERYTLRFPTDHHLNIHVKTFADPRRVNRFSTTHNAVFANGETGVNSAYLPVRGPYAPVHLEDIQVNHYLYRSQEQYLAKAMRGRSDLPVETCEERALEEFIRQTREAVVFDDEMPKRLTARRKLAHQAQSCGLDAGVSDPALIERRVAKALRLECPTAAVPLLSAWRRACPEDSAARSRLWRATARVLAAFGDLPAASRMIARAMRQGAEVDNYLALSEIFEAKGELVAALTALYSVAEYTDTRQREEQLRTKLKEAGSREA